MRKIYKCLFVVGFLSLFWLLGYQKVSAKTEYIEQGKTIQHDLDGDGKKEKIKYTFVGTSDNYEDGYSKYTLKIFINDKVVFTQTEKDRWIYEVSIALFDYNSKDKYTDIMISYADLNYVYARDVYRYKKKKLSYYFGFGSATDCDSMLPDNQNEDSHIRVDNRRYSLIGDFYVREEYKIKNKKLVLVKPKNYEYKVITSDNFYYRDEDAYRYVIEEGKSVYLEKSNGDYDVLYAGTVFNVTKLKCNIIDSYDGTMYPEIVKAYITVSDGRKGWIDIHIPRYYTYEDYLVSNPHLYGM